MGSIWVAEIGLCVDDQKALQTSLLKSLNHLNWGQILEVGAIASDSQRSRCDSLIAGCFDLHYEEAAVSSLLLLNGVWGFFCFFPSSNKSILLWGEILVMPSLSSRRSCGPAST